jgi:uncharacterized protein (TIGR02466 family)
MAFIDIFPTIILGEKLNNINFNDLNNYKNIIKSLSFKDLDKDGKASYNQKVLEIDTFIKLKENILKFSKLYLDKLGHIYEDLQISNSWVNILNKNETIHQHAHANSYISGVFYFDYSSPITFQSPQSHKWSFKAEYKNLPIYQITPEPNLLIIFPSWLEHNVNFNNGSDRISIAFNIIPKGEFGPNTGKLYL